MSLYLARHLTRWMFHQQQHTLQPCWIPPSYSSIIPTSRYGTASTTMQATPMAQVTDRIMLSGHSHQAWPNVSFAAQQQAWLDAAEHVDAKWSTAFDKAARVQRGFADAMEDPDGEYSLGMVPRYMQVGNAPPSPQPPTPTSCLCTGYTPCPVAPRAASSPLMESFSPCAASCFGCRRMAGRSSACLPLRKPLLVSASLLH